MTQDPLRTSRYVRSDKTNLKYGVQSYDLKANRSGRLFLYLLLVLGVMAAIGFAVWWFGFRGSQQPAYQAVHEETSEARQDQPKTGAKPAALQEETPKAVETKRR